MNDLENIPFGIIAGWISVTHGVSQDAALYLWAVFTVARVLHTLSYAFELQPHRGGAWIVGVLCILGHFGNALFALFK